MTATPPARRVRAPRASRASSTRLLVRRRLARTRLARSIVEPAVLVRRSAASDAAGSRTAARASGSIGGALDRRRRASGGESSDGGSRLGARDLRAPAFALLGDRARAPRAVRSCVWCVIDRRVTRTQDPNAIGAASQLSSRCAAARESSLALRRRRPVRWAMRVVKRSSYISTGTSSPSAPRQARRELARLARLLAVAAAQRQRQPDDHALDLALAHQLAQRARARACVRGPLDRLDRRHDRARRVADRAAAARAAVVEREHAHRPASAGRERRRSPPAPPRSRRRASRARARRPAPSCRGPPPPPPTTSAATLTTAPAFTPRATSAGATLATQVHAPVGGGAEHDRRRRRACPSGGRRASSSAFASGTSTTRGEHRRAVDLRRLSRQSVEVDRAGAAAPPAPPCLERLLELACAPLAASRPARRASSRTRAQLRGDLAEHAGRARAAARPPRAR